MDLSALDREIARLSAPLVVSSRAREALAMTVTARRLAKGEHLVREGDSAASLYFVGSGVLRYYYLSDGVEHTGQFFDAGMFLADVHSASTGAPAEQNIDALEPADVLCIPLSAVRTAYDADHAFERFGRRVMEEAMAGSQRRSASLLKLSPEERYERFVAARPELARRVPLYVVASYLGVTPEALSRIRRRRTTP